LDKIYLGPGCADCLREMKASPGENETLASAEKRLQEYKRIFRQKCLDFYIKAAKNIQDRLPMNEKVVLEMAFLDPQVLLSSKKRVETDGLPELSELGFRFKVGKKKELLLTPRLVYGTMLEFLRRL